MNPFNIFDEDGPLSGTTTNSLDRSQYSSGDSQYRDYSITSGALSSIQPNLPISLGTITSPSIQTRNLPKDSWLLDNLKKAKAMISANKTSLFEGLNEGLTASQHILGYDVDSYDQADALRTGRSIYQSASDAVAAANPMVGAAMKAAGSTADLLLGGLAKKSDDFSIDSATAETVGGSYGGTMFDLQEAQAKAGNKVIGANRRRRINSIIADARAKQNIMQGIADESREQQDIVNNMGDIARQAYSTQISGGLDTRYLRAEQGGVLNTTEFIPEIIPADSFYLVSKHSKGGSLTSTPEPKDTWVPEIVGISSFKSGGRVERQLDAPEIEPTTQQNLIPEGALHKNKHHMDDAEGLTKKGIPVVDSQRCQQAEIEKNEIIFTKEVTKKLEELYDIYYSKDSTTKEKDVAAIDAGKLLTKEIMLNTDDRTGLISTLQNGGSIDQLSSAGQPEKGIDTIVNYGGKSWKTKPSFPEWYETTNPIYNDTTYYDLQKAYEVLPIEKLEKWRTETWKPVDLQDQNTMWHLPSVWQSDDDTYVFLKKGKTIAENPELKPELDNYIHNKDFNRAWKLVFNPEENRWYYKRRPPLDQ